MYCIGQYLCVLHDDDKSCSGAKPPKAGQPSRGRDAILSQKNVGGLRNRAIVTHSHTARPYAPRAAPRSRARTSHPAVRPSRAASSSPARAILFHHYLRSLDGRRSKQSAIGIGGGHHHFRQDCGQGDSIDHRARGRPVPRISRRQPPSADAHPRDPQEPRPAGPAILGTSSARARFRMMDLFC